MKGFHKPTVATVAVVVLVVALAYHFLLGRKS
jgi:hypothetical protein